MDRLDDKGDAMGQHAQQRPGRAEPVGSALDPDQRRPPIQIAEGHRRELQPGSALGQRIPHGPQPRRVPEQVRGQPVQNAVRDLHDEEFGDAAQVPARCVQVVEGL
jgi:hypothetical protein